MNNTISNGLPIDNEDFSEYAVRLLVLVENTSCSEDIIPEHGLAVYIEHNGKRGLYDTGQTSLILDNAASAYVDLEDLDWIALSHGHYDHAGGLLSVLSESNKSVPVFIGENGFNKKFALRDTGKYEEIGIPFSKEKISQNAAAVTEVGELTEISPDVFMIGPAPFIEDYEEPASYLKVKDEAGNFINDLFTDERTLVLKTPEGLIVITGCAHRGAVNIIKQVKNTFKEEKITTCSRRISSWKNQRRNNKQENCHYKRSEYRSNWTLPLHWCQSKQKLYTTNA